MATPTIGTIPSLPQYQPGALPLAGTEALEIVNTTNATSAASFYINLIDLVGKAPSVMGSASPNSNDLISVFQKSSGLPISVQLGQLVGLTAILPGPYQPTTFTPNGVLYGNGTGSLQATAAGTAGWLLSGNGSALPPTFLGFQQTGTGSVVQTWTAKVRASLSVEDFGAVADYHQNFSISTAGGTSIVTCPGGTFSAADIGSLFVMAGAGVGSATYFGTITGYNPATQFITVSPNTTTAQLNVFAQWGKDNTAAIQAAINAVITVGGTVNFSSPGTYCVTTLNITNSASAPLRLKGVGGVNATRLMPMANVNVVIDASGTDLLLDSFTVGQNNQLAIPNYGLVHSITSAVPGVDFLDHRDLFWTGSYALTTVYFDRIASSSFRKCSFINYYQGTPNAGAAGVFTANNLFNFSSANATTAVGSGNVSDLNFQGCEFHAIDAAAGTGTFAAVILDGALDISFFGGLMASSHANVIQLNGTSVNTNMLFQGITVYADEGPLPTNVFGGTGTLDRGGMYHCDTSGISTIVNASVTLTNFRQEPFSVVPNELIAGDTGGKLKSITTGTGVLSALGVSVGTTGSFALFNGLPAIQTLSGTGTYTTAPLVSFLEVFGKGPGGGGGGGATGTTLNGGGGGGEGGFFYKIIVSPAATYSYAVGTGGPGGASGATGSNGSTGTGATTFGTLTANAGAFGNGAGAVQGGAGGSGASASGGDINIQGNPGGWGTFGIAAAFGGVSGLGGGGNFGTGGFNAASSAGGPGLKGGGGGGGSQNGTGGAGGDGFITVIAHFGS